MSKWDQPNNLSPEHVFVALWNRQKSYPFQCGRANVWLFRPMAHLLVAAGFPQHNAPTFHQFISAIAPNRAPTEIAGAPNEESENVTYGVKPCGISCLRVANHFPPNHPALDQSVQQGRAEQQRGQTREAQQSRGYESQN